MKPQEFDHKLNIFLQEETGEKFERSPLLAKFITEKIFNYVEPERKGTPKGQPIGFPRAKYKAALWMMTNIPRKEIAKNVGTSYEVLRKWIPQRSFQIQVIKNCEEFVSIFRNRIRERVEERQKLFDAFLKKPIKRIAESLPPTLSADEFKDGGLYGNLLSILIVEAAEKNLKKYDSLLKLEWFYLISVLRHFSGIPKKPAFEKRQKELEAKLKAKIELAMIKDTKDILSQPSISKQELKQVIFVLNVLENSKKEQLLDETAIQEDRN